MALPHIAEGVPYVGGDLGAAGAPRPFSRSSGELPALHVFERGYATDHKKSRVIRLVL